MISFTCPTLCLFIAFREGTARKACLCLLHTSNWSQNVSINDPELGILHVTIISFFFSLFKPNIILTSRCLKSRAENDVEASMTSHQMDLNHSIDPSIYPFNKICDFFSFFIEEILRWVESVEGNKTFRPTFWREQKVLE